MDEPQQMEGDPEWTPVRELAKGPRRALGVLMEKGFTTPDQYPLTLKALTSGCNQKSNRDPVVEYSEDRVEEFVEELRRIGLVAMVHTEGGRTPRYRHLVRKRYPFSEAQLALLTELWLRGRQQPGELRTRASRMTPLESQEALRGALQPLIEQGFVKTNGPLERRGVEVDHAFYPAGETVPLSAPPSASDEGVAVSSPRTAPASGALEELMSRLTELEERVDTLEQQVAALRG